MTTTSSILTNSAARAADSAHKAVDSAAGAAAPAIDRMAARAHSSVDKATSAVDALTETIADTRHDLEAVGNQLITSGTRYIRENPLTAIGIAAAVGYLLSRVSR